MQQGHRNTAADKILITYEEFILYFGVDDPGEWMLFARVDKTGVWLNSTACETAGLNKSEVLAISGRCPSGDPSKPLLTWPCTLGDIRDVVRCLGNESVYIDPFDLAGLIAEKSSSVPAAPGWDGFDEDSRTYPLELDAAFQGWRAISHGSSDSDNPKELIRGWVQKNYPALSQKALDRISLVTNWRKAPGRKSSEA